MMMLWRIGWLYQCKFYTFLSFVQAGEPEKRHDVTHGGVYHEEVSHIFHQLWQWCPCPEGNPRHHEEPYPQLLQLFCRPQPGKNHPTPFHCIWLCRDEVKLLSLTSMFAFTEEETVRPQSPSVQHWIISLTDSRRNLKTIQVCRFSTSHLHWIEQ